MLGEVLYVDGYRRRRGGDKVYKINFKRNGKVIRTEISYSNRSDGIWKVLSDSKVNYGRIGVAVSNAAVIMPIGVIFRAGNLIMGYEFV